MRDGGEWNELLYHIRNDKPWPPSNWSYLYFYAELVRHFGWDAIKAVFRTYEKLIAEGWFLYDDQAEEDHFYQVFSRQVKWDLIPLYDFWNNKISEEARMEIKSEGFAYFLPKDEITMLNSEKLLKIAVEYEIIAPDVYAP